MNHHILVPLPDNDYYLWQAMVQIASGVDATFLIYQTKRGGISEHAKNLAKIADVSFYSDQRKRKGYDAIMKPTLVARYLYEHPHVLHQQFLVIDPDVIPTNMRALPEAPLRTVLGTDVSHYAGERFLASKGAFLPLCDTLRVSPRDVPPAIGAQYVFSGIGYSFWNVAATMGMDTWNFLREWKEDTQPWCSEMYGTWLAAHHHGYNPTTHEDLSMFMAADDPSGWESEAFFHNAGVVPGGKDGHFCKIDHQSSPFFKNISKNVPQESATHRYTKLIEETEEKFGHLLW